MADQSHRYSMIRYFNELNIFETNEIDEQNIQFQRWSTRIYIFLLLISMIILIIFSTMKFSLEQSEIKNPSFSIYHELNSNYDNIKCSCTQIYNSYKKFVNISFEYHQICSSDLIKQIWIDFLFDKDKTFLYYSIDFRSIAVYQFQILKSLCELSLISLTNAIDTFYNNRLISNDLLTEPVFVAELEADILRLQSTSVSNFNRLFQNIISFMYTNQFIPAAQTSFSLSTYPNLNSIFDSWTFVQDNRFCSINWNCQSCLDKSDCKLPIGFYNNTRLKYNAVYLQSLLIEYSSNSVLKNWYTGCWPTETLLSSTLESFYNETIFNQVVSYVNSSILLNYFNKLNDSKQSYFNKNQTINTLISKLFIEQWIYQTNYSSYYTECQPRSCSYDIYKRTPFLKIITTLAGIYGGLTVVLSFLVPQIVNFIGKYFYREQNQNTIHRNKRTIRELIKILGNVVLNINFYTNQRKTSERDISYQRWSSRLYISSLLISLFILTLYSSINTTVKVIEIKNPSLNTVLDLQMTKKDLQCPCKNLISQYDKLFKLIPEYHQICSSEFITAKWIENIRLSSQLLTSTMSSRDIRLSASVFQVLNSTCLMAEKTVTNALNQLGINPFVSSELLDPIIFTEKIQIAIDQFLLSLPNEFLNLMRLMRNLTYSNQFTSASSINFRTRFITLNQTGESSAVFTHQGLDKISSNGSSENCLCVNDIQCQVQSGLFTDSQITTDLLYLIPNFNLGCFPIESTLLSSLECFYDNQPCLEILARFAYTIPFYSVKRLNSSESSRFSINTTINTLTENLFIEKWSQTIFYSSYFTECQTEMCSYKIIEKPSLIEIITVITGLIGGISKVSQLVSPLFIFVLFYLVCNNQSSSNTQINNQTRNKLRERISLLWRKFLNYIINLNIFQNINRTTDEQSQIDIEKKSTRIYIFVLIFSLSIISTYTSLSIQIDRYTISIDSLNSINDLQKTAEISSIVCPCSNLSIKQSTFIQIEPIFHEICSSDFVNENWLNILFENYQKQNLSTLKSFTYQGTAFAYFQSIKTMCNLAKQSVIDLLEQFLSRSIISIEMPDFDLFKRQTEFSLNSFQSSISYELLFSLQIFNQLSQSNSFMSAYSTNYESFILHKTNVNNIYMKSKQYNNCNCATSSSCVQSSIPSVQGYFVACLPLHSFLHSTIQCFYDQICINQIVSYVNSSFYPKVLNNTGSSFVSNITGNILIENLFIEDWISNISHGNYFVQCSPSSCSYTINKRFNILYSLTVIIGLYGGITVLLKSLIPFIIKQLQKFPRNCFTRNNQVVPY